MIQTFGPDLGPLGPNSQKNFKNWASSVTRDIMVRYHDVQYQKKLIIRS